MNKKFFITTAVAFVAFMLVGFIVHEVLLGADYMQMTFFRSKEESKAMMHFMILAHLLIAGSFVWIYRHGKENKAWLGQGLRFGFAFALAYNVGIYLIYHVILPTPMSLVIKQCIFDTVGTMGVGALVAWMERGRK
jgi:hypothetical protein